nr:PREDICTED: prolyl 4-hydroxylase subunit alpha-2-like [Bemisia tabaci]
MLRIITLHLAMAVLSYHLYSSGKVACQTSIDERLLQDYQEIDSILLDFLQEAILSIVKKLNDLKLMKNHYLFEQNHLKLDAYRYAGDIIQHFKLVKRIHYDWEDTLKTIKKNPLKDLGKKYQKLAKFTYPSMTQLKNTVHVFLGMQRSMNLSVKDLANGHHQNARYPTKLSSSDCQVIASHCIYNPTKQFAALEWLKEAYKKFDEKKEPPLNKQMLISDLAFALSKTGSIKEAVDLTHDFTTRLKMDDTNAYFDMYIHFKSKLNNQPVNDMNEGISPDDTSLETWTYPTRESHFQEVCKQLIKFPRSNTADLRCHLRREGSPLFFLSPLKEEELHLRPKISIYHEFLTNDGIDKIIESARDQMLREATRNGSSAEYEVDQYVRYRKIIFLERGISNFESLLKHTNALTGLSDETAGDIQVNYYGSGGGHAPRYDAYSEHFDPRLGNPTTTVQFYLNNVQVGGETVFDGLDVLVKPEKGSVLVWDNLRRNGLIDMFSGHGICPVFHGHQLTATLYYHHKEQVLHRPCTMNKYE